MKLSLKWKQLSEGCHGGSWVHNKLVKKMAGWFILCYWHAKSSSAHEASVFTVKFFCPMQLLSCFWCTAHPLLCAGKPPTKEAHLRVTSDRVQELEQSHGSRHGRHQHLPIWKVIRNPKMAYYIPTVIRYPANFSFSIYFLLGVSKERNAGI